MKTTLNLTRHSQTKWIVKEIQGHMKSTPTHTDIGIQQAKWLKNDYRMFISRKFIPILAQEH